MAPDIPRSQPDKSAKGKLPVEETAAVKKPTNFFNSTVRSAVTYRLVPKGDRTGPLSTIDKSQAPQREDDQQGSVYATQGVVLSSSKVAERLAGEQLATNAADAQKQENFLLQNPLKRDPTARVPQPYKSIIPSDFQSKILVGIQTKQRGVQVAKFDEKQSSKVPAHDWSRELPARAESGQTHEHRIPSAHKTPDQSDVDENDQRPGHSYKTSENSAGKYSSVANQVFS